MRKKLNLAFKSFIEKVETMSNNQVSFEKPFRELAFNGTPHRSMVQLQPTSSCLVCVVEQPPFVLTLDQVETVHFERVSFHLKNFDMVFIFKDYSRKVVMITAIPMNQLDQIKEWLNSCDIKYTEGIQNFNWAKIMKTITDDPEGFFEQGGWDFLEPEGEEEKGAGGDEDDELSDEEDDAYEPTDSEDEESASEDGSDAESDYSGSDDDDESGSAASGSGSGSGSEESGKDWSDLEEEARRADMEQDSDEDDDNKGGNKRKKPATGSSKPSSKSNGSMAKRPRK
jgi:nucleosome binding factor SPN SPT16 subunit